MKKTIFSLCKTVLICTALSFVFFFLLQMFVRAAFEKVNDMNLVLYCMNLIIYNLCFYFVRVKKREELFAPDEKFNFFTELKAYFLQEGKFLLYIYVALASLCEIDYLIEYNSTGKFFVTLCSMFFPFIPRFGIPVIRSILSLIIEYIISLLLVLFHSYRITTKKRE